MGLVFRLMFWTDWGEVPKIERAGMNGDLTTRTVIVNEEIFWPNGITIDYDSETIYWADGKLNFVAAMDFDGQNRRSIISRQVSCVQPSSNQIISMSISTEASVIPTPSPTLRTSSTGVSGTSAPFKCTTCLRTKILERWSEALPALLPPWECSF